MTTCPQRIADVTRAVKRNSTDIESVVILEEPVEFLEVANNHAISPIAFGSDGKNTTKWAIDEELTTALELGTSPVVEIKSDDIFPERYIAEDSDPVLIDL